MVLPVVFDEEDNEITYKYNGSCEKVCDIGLEYSMEGSESNLRSDLFISENPFTLEYADEETWRVNNSDEQKCKEDYNSARYHYIEIKQRNWVDINNEKNLEDLAEILIEDMVKYSNQDWRSFKSDYNLSSVISICCLSFYAKSSLPDANVKSEIKNTINNFKEFSLKKCRNQFKNDCRFLWQRITDEIYLLMIFNNVKNKKIV